MTAKASTTKASAKKTKTTKKAPKEPAAKTISKSTSKAVDVKKPLMTTKKTDPKHVLRLWNIRLAIVLVVLAAAVVVAGDSSSVPVTTQYLAKDVLATEAAGGNEALAPATRHLMDLPVSWLVAKFLIILAVVYLLAATLLRKQYEAWLDKGVNNLRWIGFGLAGGAAVSGVAMLGGVSDLATLLLIFGSVVLAAVFAGALEQLGSDRRLRRLLAAGAVTGLVLPWLGFVANIAGVLKYDGSLPMYLYFVYALVTLWFVAIALATNFRIKRRGKWADSFFAERMFMVLGFAAVTVLALQIFAGTLQP